MAVSKSTNGGTSWTRYSLTTSTGFCYAIAVDPTSSNIVYAGGQGGLYKTTNGGSSWSNITGAISGTIKAIAIDPDNPSTVFAGANGVFKSTNGGSSWTNTGCSGVNTLLVDPDNPNEVYAGSYSGVYKSTSGGGNWTQMNEGLENTQVVDLGIDPADYLYCGTGGGSMHRWSLSGPGIAGEKMIPDPIFKVVPNPLRDRTTIIYSLNRETSVELAIFDVEGRLVRNLVASVKGSGKHAITWNGCDDHNRPVPAGIYFLRLNAEQKTMTQKIVRLR